MYHLLAILTVIVWGSTFVSTKVLLDQGLSPSDIFVLRFAIAYIGIALFCHKQWFCNNWKDEAIMALSGLTGGSLYFIGENTALLYTQAGNVSLIVCLAPLLTALFSLFNKNGEKTSMKLWIGSFISLAGVAFVINDEGGSTSNPFLGNMLALLSAVCWAIYQIIVNPISHKYDVRMLTRKIFGYGILTIIPYWYLTAPESGISHILPLLEQPLVIGNILFLGFVASLLGYWSWNIIVQKLGSVISSNYIYLNPFVTCIFSYFILSEKLTLAIILGEICILLGIYLATGTPQKQGKASKC